MVHSAVERKKKIMQLWYRCWERIYLLHIFLHAIQEGRSSVQVRCNGLHASSHPVGNIFLNTMTYYKDANIFILATYLHCTEIPSTQSGTSNCFDQCSYHADMGYHIHLQKVSVLSNVWLHVCNECTFITSLSMPTSVARACSRCDTMSSIQATIRWEANCCMW